MAKEYLADEKKNKAIRPDHDQEVRKEAADPGAEVHHLGNRALQRLLAQRSGDGPAELHHETAGRINQVRGGGQSLDGAVQKQMGAALGQDFSGVRVHTSPEADALNQQLSARAFTTGQDIFFKAGEYNPGSSGGQELLAHELTHVVQQS